VPEVAIALSLFMMLACLRTGFDATPPWARLRYGLVTECQDGARRFTRTSTGLDSALSRKRRETPKC
jgi:hypothetical protein